MKVRIGKDIILEWAILTDGTDTPLEGRDLSLELRGSDGSRRLLAFTCRENVLTTTIYGTEQRRIGTYSLTLWENRNKAGQTAVDYTTAFTLVSSTDLETDGSEARLRVVHVKLETSYLRSVGGGGGSIEVVDNLDSEASDKALSARQGKVLNEKIDSIGTGVVQETGDSEALVMSQKSVTRKVEALATMQQGVTEKIAVKSFEIKNSYIDKESGNLQSLGGYCCTELIPLKNNEAIGHSIANGSSSCLIAVYSISGEYLKKYSVFGNTSLSLQVGVFVAPFDCQVRVSSIAKDSYYIEKYASLYSIEKSEREADIAQISYILDNFKITKNYNILEEATGTGFIDWETGQIVSDGFAWYRYLELKLSPGESVTYSSAAGISSCLMAVYDNDGNYVQDLSVKGKGEAESSIVTGTFFSTGEYTVRIVGVTQLPSVCQITKWGATQPSPGTDWSNKTWTCVGDSLTERNNRSDKFYHDYIKEKTGITVVNMGVSGTGYMQKQSTNLAFYQRIQNIQDCDVVTIFGSFNDLDGGFEIGAPSDTGTETICGCINTTLDTLYSILPTVRLGIVSPTPWHYYRPSLQNGRADQYVESLKSICELRSIPFLDLFHGSNLRPWDAAFRSLVYSKDEGNGIHPNELGHEILSSKFMVFLNSLIS